MSKKQTPDLSKNRKMIEEAIESYRKEHVTFDLPESSLQKIKKMIPEFEGCMYKFKGKSFSSKDGFLNQVQKSIGKEQIDKYEDLLLEQLREHHPSLEDVKIMISHYIGDNTGKYYSIRAISRHIKSMPEDKVGIYAGCFHKKFQKSLKWIEELLESLHYPKAKELLAELCTTNVPRLRENLLGQFLGRKEILKKLQEWADDLSIRIAILYGFGGNGKSEIQKFFGKNTTYRSEQRLVQNPFESAFWISARDYPITLTDILREIIETSNLVIGVQKNISLAAIQSEKIKNIAKAYLEKRRCLILIDNFETILPPKQGEILNFFSALQGSSKTLISSRECPEQFLQKHNEKEEINHLLIRVDGFSKEDAGLIIQKFSGKKLHSNCILQEDDLKRLMNLTGNNPMMILAGLGFAVEGMPFSEWLDDIKTVGPNVERLYDEMMYRLWKYRLTPTDRKVLMAKALFPYSVTATDLGQVAGVNDDFLRESIEKFERISCAECDHQIGQDPRVDLHPLAQTFARNALQNSPEFEQELEGRWWKEFAPAVIKKAGERVGEFDDPGLEADLSNVLELLKKHIQDHQSPYRVQAAKIFGDYGGLGHILRYKGRWEEVEPLAKLVLDVAIKLKDPRLIGECARRILNRGYRERGDEEKARSYIEEAELQNIELKDPWLKALILSTRAGLLRYRNRLQVAESIYQEALNIFQGLRGERFYLIDSYMWLGMINVEMATQDLDSIAWEHLKKAEHWLDKARNCMKKGENDGDWEMGYRRSAECLDRGIIARIRGNYDEARELFQCCKGQFPSMKSVARWYIEMALNEHLAGNRKQAYSYEKLGEELQKQLGINNALPPYHCYRIIKRMKEEGKW